MTWNWDDPLAKMPGETNRALQAFHDYVDLGPGRSLPLLEKGYKGVLPPEHVLYAFFQKYTDISGNHGETIPSRQRYTIERWSSKFQWQARLARLLEIRAAQREAVRLARQAELEDADWRDGAELRARVKEFLDVLPQFKQRTVKESSGPDGATVTVITLELNTSIAQLAQGLKTASDIQRHAAAEPDITVDLPGGSLLNALVKAMDELVTGAEVKAAGDTDQGAAE